MGMREARWAGWIALLLGAAVVAVLVGPRLIQVSSPGPGPIKHPSTLPAGICMPSVDALPISQATRMEAKLITLESGLTGDPYFPWAIGSAATSARTSLPKDLPKFYWVVAAEGQFHLNIPVPPGAAPPVLINVVLHLTANSCQVAQVTAVKQWPSWFDQLPPVSDVRLK